MKIHIASDLHLNFADLVLPGGADLLILAGDITEHNYIVQHQRFFREECAKYPKVLYVFGNHEFYRGYIDATPFLIRALMPKNVQVLEDEIVDIGDWTFVGSTLWTDMNRGCPMTKYHLKAAMMDFKLISMTKEPWSRFTPDSAQALHYKNKGYIDIVSRDLRKDKNIFVITHHAPTFMSVDPIYAHDRYTNGGYASGLGDFILDRPNIKYWVHGHMHNNSDYMVGDCRVICHPRGYAGHESISNDYQPFELEI